MEAKDDGDGSIQKVRPRKIWASTGCNWKDFLLLRFLDSFGCALTGLILRSEEDPGILAFDDELDNPRPIVRGGGGDWIRELDAS
jgi:hypothetical protein